MPKNYNKKKTFSAIILHNNFWNRYPCRHLPPPWRFLHTVPICHSQPVYFLPCSFRDESRFIMSTFLYCTLPLPLSFLIQCGVMQMLRLSGVNVLDFWCARFIYDCIHYLLVMAIFSFFLLQPFLPVRRSIFSFNLSICI